MVGFPLQPKILINQPASQPNNQATNRPKTCFPMPSSQPKREETRPASLRPKAPPQRHLGDGPADLAQLHHRHLQAACLRMAGFPAQIQRVTHLGASQHGGALLVGILQGDHKETNHLRVPLFGEELILWLKLSDLLNGVPCLARLKLKHFTGPKQIGIHYPMGTYNNG